MTCGGFEQSVGSWVASNSCLSARLGIVILFFLIAIIRKWGAEEWGISYSFFFSIIAGSIVYFILVTIFGNFRISFGIGLVAAIVVGYGAGFFFDTGGDEYE